MDWRFTGDRPVYQQIMSQIRGQIIQRKLLPGGRIPSVRELAAQAQVNPNTIQRAMNELEREGLLISGGTNGRTVTEDLEVLERIRTQELTDLARECAERFRVFGLSPREAAAAVCRSARTVSESSANNSRAFETAPLHSFRTNLIVSLWDT